MRCWLASIIIGTINLAEVTLCSNQLNSSTQYRATQTQKSRPKQALMTFCCRKPVYIIELNCINLCNSKTPPNSTIMLHGGCIRCGSFCPLPRSLFFSFPSESSFFLKDFFLFCPSANIKRMTNCKHKLYVWHLTLSVTTFEQKHDFLLTSLIIWHLKQSNGSENTWKSLTRAVRTARILMYAPKFLFQSRKVQETYLLQN